MLAEVVTVGLGLAIIVMFAIPPQGPLVPATVYIVVANGLIMQFTPTTFPGIQVYVLAPPAVNVATFPAHTADDVDMAITGKAETVIVCVVE